MKLFPTMSANPLPDPSDSLQAFLEAIGKVARGRAQRFLVLVHDGFEPLCFVTAPTR